MMKYANKLVDKEFVVHYLENSKNLKEATDVIKGLPTLEVPIVHPFKVKAVEELTKSEQKQYKDMIENNEMPLCMFDCELPDNEQNIIIFTDKGELWQTTFYNDEYGCYISEGMILRNGMAWMPRPRILRQSGEIS